MSEVELRADILLGALSKWPKCRMLETARELGEGFFGSSDAARQPLIRLRNRGFVEKAGFADRGATTWRITDAGRKYVSNGFRHEPHFPAPTQEAPSK